MRLLDKLLSQAPASARPLLTEMTKQETFACVVVDEVARHYYEHNQVLWGPEDFPYFSPPWMNSFIEWREVAKIRTDHGWMDGNPEGQIGCLVMTDVMSPAACRKHVERLSGQSTPESEFAGATKVVTLQPVIYAASRLRIIEIQIFVLTDDTGKVINRLYIGPFLNAAQDLHGRDEARRFCETFVHVVGLTLTFLNCKNVKLEDRTEEFQPSAKLRRRLKLPEIKRYTLNIGGHSTNRGADKPQAEFGVMPFHLCRGHFATYTAEKPLFGRLTGKFWISAHMRGKKEQGEIVKDYAVAAQ